MMDLILAWYGNRDFLLFILNDESEQTPMIQREKWLIVVKPLTNDNPLQYLISKTNLQREDTESVHCAMQWVSMTFVVYCVDRSERVVNQFIISESGYYAKRK